MADITVRNQGNVSDEGKVNWRGDQVSVTPGDQSIYDSSTVQLADLGSRKVVGDRVFRYAKAGGAIGAGDVAGANVTSIVNATQGAVDASGGKTFTFYFANSVAANAYAEGYLIAQSGTAANLGHMYRVKSHGSVGDTSNGTLTLYDPLKLEGDTTDSWSLFSNHYSSLLENTSGTQAPAGVCPIAVTTNDYFWLQTWGPGCVKAGSAALQGEALIAQNTGQVVTLNNTSAGGDVKTPIGFCLQPTMTVSEYGLAFISIAP